MDNFAYQSDLMQLIVLAMRERGNGNLTEAEMSRIIDLLSKVSLEEFKHDIKLAPTWVQDILIKHYEVR
jgi:hypothetical protein